MRRFKLTLLLILMGFSQMGYGQNTATIKGVVTDKSDGLTLPAATVVVAGTNLGAATNSKGEYTLSNIPNGRNNIIISFIGYNPDTIKVDLAAGETKIQKKAIQQQLKDDRIANIVSADKIKELPDVNAAEAIARLPGIALVRSGGEGQKVIVRGLAPKFSAVTINGTRVPSNSGVDRSIDLSMISPELLDGIEVFKTPLPDMDAEAIGGTINLKISKARESLHVLAKGLVGYNDMSETFKDYKGILMVSDRVFDNHFGFLIQGSKESFNRSGDFTSNSWQTGATNDEGVTEFLGKSLTYTDASEVRDRTNASMNLDYSINKNHRLGFLALYSNTSRDKFSMSTIFSPHNPSVDYKASGTNGDLKLQLYSLSGEHKIGTWDIDWSGSSSITDGDLPYNYNMSFTDKRSFNSELLDVNGHPRNYPVAAPVGIDNVYLQNGSNNLSWTEEKTNTAFVNIKKSFSINDKIKGYIKTGVKYISSKKNRKAKTESEVFYYLGGVESRNAIAEWEKQKDKLDVVNGGNILATNFASPSNDIKFEDENGNPFAFPLSIDRNLVKDWYTIQQPFLNDHRGARGREYIADETILAGYLMLKLEFGDKLTVIPGFRIEQSDNSYFGYILNSISGRQGEMGTVEDTTTYQKYSEFLPHLHIKYEPFKWLDLRASYSVSLARPNFNWVAPTASIHTSSNLYITSGNPNLKHSRSENYDISATFHHWIWGLFSVNGFYKKINNFSTSRSYQLTDEQVAEESGWPGYKGFLLNTYVNLPESKVWGVELDLQTNLSMLPKPFDGVVISVNYARQFSETTDYNLSSESKTTGFPPVTVVTYTSTPVKTELPSMTPHIFRSSMGYDYKGFSARVSAIYQSDRIIGYSILENMNRLSYQFWRFDASLKQRIGQRFSLFANLNNFTNQKDISYTAIRGLETINSIQRFGMTGQIGIQFKY